MNYARLCLFFLVFGAIKTPAQDTFQLAPPYLRYASVFFEKSTTVAMEFAQPGTQIHYTTNGQEPSERDPVYTHPIQLKKSLTTLKAKVFGAGFMPSATATATFYKKGLAIDSISTPLPHERYPGTGAFSLIDGQGGNSSYLSKTWMGFQSDDVMITLKLKKPKKVKQVLLHVLENQDAWIFQAQKISVFYLVNDPKGWMMIGTKTFSPEAQRATKASCQALLVDTKYLKIKTTDLLVIIYPLAKLPDWHPGKGSPAWLFLDEVKVY